MRFRYTTKELTKWTDSELLYRLVIERQSDCTNVYSQLYKRLAKIKQRLEKKLPKPK